MDNKLNKKFKLVGEAVVKLKNEIKRIDADFMFFDGASETASYHKTPELVAWFYNYADE